MEVATLHSFWSAWCRGGGGGRGLKLKSLVQKQLACLGLASSSSSYWQLAAAKA
jgi:hypothetical protein